MCKKRLTASAGGGGRRFKRISSPPKNENPVIISSPSRWWKVGWSFRARQTFLELHSKTAFSWITEIDGDLFQNVRKLRKKVSCSDFGLKKQRKWWALFSELQWSIDKDQRERKSTQVKFEQLNFCLHSTWVNVSTGDSDVNIWNDKPTYFFHPNSSAQHWDNTGRRYRHTLKGDLSILLHPPRKSFQLHNWSERVLSCQRRNVNQKPAVNQCWLSRFQPVCLWTCSRAAS